MEKKILCSEKIARILSARLEGNPCPILQIQLDSLPFGFLFACCVILFVISALLALLRLPGRSVVLTQPTLGDAISKFSEVARQRVLLWPFLCRWPETETGSPQRK